MYKLSASLLGAARRQAPCSTLALCFYKCCQLIASQTALLLLHYTVAVNWYPVVPLLVDCLLLGTRPPGVGRHYWYHLVLVPGTRSFRVELNFTIYFVADYTQVDYKQRRWLRVMHHASNRVIAQLPYSCCFCPTVPLPSYFVLINSTSYTIPLEQCCCIYIIIVFIQVIWIVCHICPDNTFKDRDKLKSAMTCASSFIRQTCSWCSVSASIGMPYCP